MLTLNPIYFFHNPREGSPHRFDCCTEGDGFSVAGNIYCILCSLGRELGLIDGANTSIKFADGVLAKDARANAGVLRTEAAFIECQPRLSFAPFFKGEHECAVSLSVVPGRMEALPRISVDERDAVLTQMRRWVNHAPVSRSSFAPLSPGHKIANFATVLAIDNK